MPRPSLRSYPSRTRRKRKTIISHNRKYRLGVISSRASICSAIKYWRARRRAPRTARRGCIIPRIWFTTPPVHAREYSMVYTVQHRAVSPCAALHLHKLWIRAESGAIGYSRDLLSLRYVPLRIAPRFIWNIIFELLRSGTQLVLLPHLRLQFTVDDLRFA